MGRAKTFFEVLNSDHPQPVRIARRTPSVQPDKRREEAVKKSNTTLTDEECRALSEQLLQSVLRDVLGTAATTADETAPVAKAGKRAVDELEERVQARINANPRLGRESIVGEIFAADPDLYRRYRDETTVTHSGSTLAERESARVSRLVDYGSAVREVKARADALIAKSGARLPYEQALRQVFRDDPVLHDRWRRANE
jgi:hypothetical protein